MRGWGPLGFPEYRSFVGTLMLLPDLYLLYQADLILIEEIWRSGLHWKQAQVGFCLAKKI